MEQHIADIAIYALPVIFAITVHEAAHGYVARYFGDNTAYALGRVSLNPLKHIDPMGTVLIPLTLKLLGAPPFGWAKPVPVNFSALRRPKQDMLWVAAAGPGANFLMILFWASVAKLAGALGGSYALPMGLMGVAGIQVNSVLMVLNLIPLPPLDGGRIAVSLLPYQWAVRLARVEPYGLFLIAFLLVSGILSQVMGPFVDGTIMAFIRAFGLTWVRI